jgi:hypothetical protein
MPDSASSPSKLCDIADSVNRARLAGGSGAKESPALVVSVSCVSRSSGTAVFNELADVGFLPLLSEFLKIKPKTSVKLQPFCLCKVSTSFMTSDITTTGSDGGAGESVTSTTSFGLAFDSKGGSAAGEAFGTRGGAFGEVCTGKTFGEAFGEADDKDFGEAFGETLGTKAGSAVGEAVGTIGEAFGETFRTTSPVRILIAGEVVFVAAGE